MQNKMKQKPGTLLNKKYSTKEDALTDWTTDTITITNNKGIPELYYLKEFFEQVGEEPIISLDVFKYRSYFRYTKHQ